MDEPFDIEPKEVPLIWGGQTLVRRFHKPGDPDASIGESWECWDENVARTGPYAGKSIATLRTQLGAALVGALDATKPFPILTKFIDAQAPLSVQVHPDDAYAQRVEGQPNGKTECWLILDAEPDAQIVLGWARDTNRDEYIQRVADGTLGDILRRVAVTPGDVFYLPAGTVHSIGAGIVLFETQQTSDLTYRIFDWNRVGADGKPRPLHVEKAADVLDYQKSNAGALAHIEYSLDGVTRTALVADRHFIVERVASSPNGTIDMDGMPLIVTALDAPIVISAADVRLELAPYETGLVPASVGSISLESSVAQASALAIAPPRAADSFARRLERAGVPASSAQAFLAQFS